MRGPWFTVEVSGESMQPTYSHGDWLLIRRRSQVRTGDVVVLRRDDVGLLIKRVVAVSDGDAHPELWLEGDNPESSTDSRTWGWVPCQQVLGRVVMRFRRAPHPTRP